MTLFYKIDKYFEILVSIFENSHLFIKFSGSTFVIIYAINTLYILNIDAHDVFESMPVSEANILRQNTLKEYSQEQGRYVSCTI